MTYEWTITLQADSTTYTVQSNGLLGDYPEVTRGETTSFTFSFSGVTESDSGTGGTAGGTSGFTAGGESGATAGSTMTTGQVSRYERVRDLLDHAGSVSTFVSQVGVPSYRDRLPTGASVDTLAVKLAPGASVGAGVGVWGVVTGGRDRTTIPAANARLTLEVYVLAEASEFADHAALESARGAALL